PNQPNLNSNDDIDPSLLQPINVIHPPQLSDLPNIDSDTDIDTVSERVNLATEIHKNKSNELCSLLNQLHETQTQSQQSSPLQILEQHLEGELPQNHEQTTKPNPEQQQPTSEAEKIQENLMTKFTSLSSEPTTSGPSFSHISEAPPVTNPELAIICNNILNKMKSLHQLRYSFTEPYLYVGAWETLRNDINDDLNKIQNGDINELMEFQKNTKEWKDYVENPAFEAFKAEVKDELSAQKMNLQELAKNQKDMSLKQEAVSAKQEEISADLKAILSILSQNRKP
ncbi:hypothetical protein A2U01_0008224, partial [Trifolium medium]|nr:hypothetical protein [Trifolium medium]